MKTSIGKRAKSFSKKESSTPLRGHASGRWSKIATQVRFFDLVRMEDLSGIFQNLLTPFSGTVFLALSRGLSWGVSLKGHKDRSF